MVLMKRIGEVFLIEVPAEKLVSMLESNEMKS
jgi:hypothetical protein